MAVWLLSVEYSNIKLTCPTKLENQTSHSHVGGFQSDTLLEIKGDWLHKDEEKEKKKKTLLKVLKVESHFCASSLSLTYPERVKNRGDPD